MPSRARSTNNEAEYEALLTGLRMAAIMSLQVINVKVDSKLVASQMNGSYNIPRNLNQKADVLSKLATVSFDHLIKEVLVEVLSKISTYQNEVGAIVEEEEDNWMTPIIKCFEEGVWQEDTFKARTLRRRSINTF
ncbi:reverse transcriptase domain-containing protein [Tanacetum coccineum]